MGGGNKVGDGDMPTDEAGRAAASASARRAALQRAKKLKQQQQVLRQIKRQQARASNSRCCRGTKKGRITKVPGRTTAMGQQVFAQQAMIGGQGTGATKPPAGARVIKGNILTNIDNLDPSIFDTRKI